MGRGYLSENEKEVLLKNPYVLEVKGNQIIFSEEFKVYFMKEYIGGKGPTSIFTEAGFDKKILGSKRIERAAARWKEIYEAREVEGVQREKQISQKQKENSIQKKIEALESETMLLRNQISILCKKLDLENIAE